MDTYTTDKKLIATAMKRVTTTGFEGFNIENEAKKIWKLLEPYHKNTRPMPRIRIYTQGCRVYENGTVWRSAAGKHGHAYYYKDEIMLKTSPTWLILAHELTHMAVECRWQNGQWNSHDRTFYNCLRDISQRRFKCVVSFYEVSRYGYEVDNIIDRELDKNDVFRIFRKDPKPTEETE